MKTHLDFATRDLNGSVTIARLQHAGYPVDRDTGETCCYAVQTAAPPACC
jgi:hypothetical protein